MKILVLIIYTEDWQQIADVVLPNAEKYCRKHHYSFFFNRQKTYNGFDKIKAIKAIFERNDADFVMVVDCDAIIVNHAVKIEDIINEHHSFWITLDVNGLNGGVFIVKNNEWSMYFLDYILLFEGVAKCEQDAISLFVLDNPEDINISILPQKVMNSYRYDLYQEHQDMIGKDGDFVGGDFILHLPGIGMEQRLNILKNTPVIL